MNWNNGNGKISQLTFSSLGNLSESNENITLKTNPKFIIKERKIGTQDTRTAQKVLLWATYNSFP